MGRGRGNPARALALGALSILALAACGSEEHENAPRPPLAIEVTVSISEEAVNLSPDEIGQGSGNVQRLSQNEAVRQPEIKEDIPQTVNFTISNTTGFDTALEIDGPQRLRSGPIVANGTAEYKVDLPTGQYLVAAADIPGAAAADLSIGPKRYSSSKDLLLP
jgi:hypothetical protein